MKNKNSLLILFILFVSSGALAAKTLLLKEAIQEGLANSPKVQAAQAAATENSWKKTEALKGFLPSLNGSVNYVPNHRYMLLDVNLGGTTTSMEQVSPSTLYSLNLTLPIFDGFSSTHRYHSSENLERSADFQLQWTRFSAERQIALQFYRTLANSTLREVAEQNLHTLEDHLKDAQALKKAGISTSYDVLRVEVQVSEAKSELMNSDDNLAIAKLKLAELLGKNSESRELSGELPVLQDELRQKIKETLNPNQRLDLRALNEKVTSVQELSAATSSYYVPRLSAFAQYQYYNNVNTRFSDTDHSREAYFIGLSLVWNFFDGMESIAKSHQTEAQAEQAEKALTEAQIRASQDFEVWKRKLRYFQSVYLARLSEVEKSTEAVRLAREGRRAGSRTTTDLLDAELELFRAKAGKVNAQIGAIEALINLELASGQKIYDFN